MKYSPSKLEGAGGVCPVLENAVYAASSWYAGILPAIVCPTGYADGSSVSNDLQTPIDLLKESDRRLHVIAICVKIVFHIIQSIHLEFIRQIFTVKEGDHVVLCAVEHI